MNQSITSIFETTVEIVSLGLTFWGAFKMNRKYFLSGICLFSILPIMGETSTFLGSHEALSLLTAGIFVAQLILSFPSNITYNIMPNKFELLNKQNNTRVMGVFPNMYDNKMNTCMQLDNYDIKPYDAGSIYFTL